jgi:hypothetical protein
LLLRSSCGNDKLILNAVTNIAVNPMTQGNIRLKETLLLLIYFWFC